MASHSFAFWLIAAGIALLLINMLGYLAFGLELDPCWMGWFALFLQISAMVLRIIKQPSSKARERIKALVVVGLAALLALAAVPRAFGAPIAPQVMQLAEGVPLKVGNELASRPELHPRRVGADLGLGSGCRDVVVLPVRVRVYP